MSLFVPRPGRFSVKIQLGLGKDNRVSRALPAGLTREQAQERDQAITRLVAALLEADQPTLAERVLNELAAEPVESWARTLAYVEQRFLSGARKPRRELVTVTELGRRWTSGELAAQHPDQVKTKKGRTPKQDATRLRLYVEPLVGDLPVEAVTLDHLDEVMARLPARLAPGTRRQVAQTLRRLFALAVYPCRLLTVSPIPAGWLPRGARRSSLWLYPAEEAALLADTRIPLGRRMAYALETREGLRRAEAAGLRWSDLDLERGTITLRRHKTDGSQGPRTWLLRPDVVETLRWLERRAKKSEPVLAFRVSNLPLLLRRDLGRLGARPELLSGPQQLRAHDLRASFVTVALAQGRSEAWVTDRTGHTSSAMLRRYQRQARHAAELAVGDWHPLHLALPETRKALQRVSAHGADPLSPPPGTVMKSRLFQIILATGSTGPRSSSRRTPAREPLSRNPLILALMDRGATPVRPCGDAAETAPLRATEGWS